MPEYRSRHDLQRAAEAVASHPTVAAVDVLTDDRTDGPLAELVLAPHVGRVPPGVCRLLGREDCGIRRVVPQGEPGHLVIEVL
jgi:hypothetical protein